MHPLPEDYVVRRLSTGDLPAAQALLDACASADTGEPCVHDVDIALESRSRYFDIAHDAWVVLGPDGRLAGLGYLNIPQEDGVVWIDHHVRPDLRHLGLDDTLFDLIEERATHYARERRDSGGVRLIAECEQTLARHCELLAERGFAVVRDIYQMRLDFTGPVPAAQVPAGIAVRAARFGEDDHLLHAASEDAFSEHFLYCPLPFEEWRLRSIQLDSIDPDLWLVAWDGGEVAGQALALRRGDEVHVEDLSVRKPWRGRGLGLALLLAVFGRLEARGYPFVRLFVDAQNATGALDLYVKAGMRVERHFHVFEKAFTV